MPTVPPAPFSLWLAAASLSAGALLGLAYFGGLWWSLQRLPQGGLTRGWLALSFAVRMVVVLAGFGVMVRLGGWWPPLLGLAGFLATRAILVHRWGPWPLADSTDRRKEE